MHSDINKADLQFRELCKSWSALTQHQKNKIERLAVRSGIHKTKNAIVAAVSMGASAIAFLVFRDAAGTAAATAIGVFGYLIGLVVGDFLFDAIANITR